ncbi:unnamed protein product [Closterium sp. NIES-53]
MAAQELRWLTYLLTDLGERPCSSPVLYVDNKAMVALCQEHRQEHRTKHIALRYFLARELQQRGQLRLAYVATGANTADIFTQALQFGDHQCFCIVLGLWLSRNATARLAIRNHLPATECAHLGKHRTAQALYNAVVACYASPASAAIGRLLLPYLFPELSAFATVADLVTHLRTSDARYRATVPRRDHFLTLDPTSLTVDLLEQHLLVAETSAVAVGAARGTPRSPFFEGMSELLRLVRSAATARARVAGVREEAAVVVEVAVGVVVGAAVEEAEVVEVVAAVGPVAEVEARVAAVEAAEGVAAVEAVGPVVVGLDLSMEALVVVGASISSGSETCPYVICTGARTGWTCRRLHTERHCFARLDDAWRTEFGDDVKLPHWAELLRLGVAIFDLDIDVIISPMYALSFSAEGDCYWCVLLDPGIAAATLGASVSGTPPGTALAEALHTFTLDSDASRWSSLYTLATEPPQIAASAQVSASSQVAASCSCRLLSHQTLLWHHRLGHPSLPHLLGMHSRLLVSCLPRSLPPLPPSPAPPCLPCVEGRQRAAPHSSSFPPTTAPLQTLHRDMWGPARVSGQGRERYFLLVVDDYTRYTIVFPLRSEGEVSAILIPWIRTVRLQLRERFGHDLPVLRLHSDRGGEFSSDLLRDFCRGEGILHSFTFPDSPQQNGIAERRIGLVMEVARTSMIHAATPHFLWPFAVQYAAHQLNLWPRVSLPETSPTLRWTGKVGDASVFRGPAPSGVSQVDPLLGTAPVQIAVVSGDAPDAASWGAASRGAEPGGAGSEGAGSGGVESEGAEPGGAESEGAESGGAEPRGAASSGGPAGASPQLSSQQLHAGAGGDAVTTGAGDPKEPQAAGAGGAGAGVARVGGPGAGGAGAAGAEAVDPGAGGAEGIMQPHPYFVLLLQHVLGIPSSTGLPPPFLCPPPDQSQPPLQPASPLPVPSPYTEQSGGLTERLEPASRPVLHVRTARHAPCLRPPPVSGTHTMALRPSFVPLYVPLPASPESSLPEVPYPESDRARAANPTVACLLTTAVTDPSFDFAAAFALVPELLDFAADCCLDYASALVAESVPASPPSVGGECALCTDVLEDRQEDFECLAAAVPRFASMLLAPDRDPDAPDIPTPRSYVEAITGPYSSQWQADMDPEMASWKSAGTYVDEVPPPGVNIVDGMWIFRLKRPPGSPPAFKARYVARGFSQRQGVDYFQTFSPTLKMITLRVLLNVAAQRDYELHSLPGGQPFLEGSLHEEIWLRRPPGFTGSFPTGTQWSLRRPVYGLRQAPREWHNTLRTTLAALGFVPSTADPSLFLHTDTSLPPFYVLEYVDDLVFATADSGALTLVKSELQKRHTCTDLGPSALRLPVLLATAHSSLYQPLALSSTFGRFRRAKWSVPRACGLPHVPDDLHTTRPRIPSHPSGSLRGSRTSGMGLVLGGRGPVLLTGHADASWAGDSAMQRSSQGYTFSLGSGSVSWRSTRSSSVLSSSCEAEIYAGAMAEQELRWLTYLLTDLREQPRSPLSCT